MIYIIYIYIEADELLTTPLNISRQFQRDAIAQVPLSESIFWLCNFNILALRSVNILALRRLGR